MKGLGTDEKQLVAILCHRSNAQRQVLKTQFMSLLGRDLLKDLKSETSGNFYEVLEALLQASDEFDARHFNKAIRGLGTDGS
jgi:predicted negative regulator of RcsB-dependent stress response